ncbi:hypothetical protein C1H71_08110 [Iodobacter fluviatilis]|uniref:EAL domain-containing protein n=1 Tax=Iodobacter fluviatilis TaxID=537 RepID=A0A7G3G8Y3_9NEIS|nr:hypothetical protein C1H71_08110 [Iodobacter fluviatilis]
MKDIANNQSQQRVCHALLYLASALELKIITEGIETPEEAHWLFAQSVLYAQGFWFNHPLVCNQCRSYIFSAHYTVYNSLLFKHLNEIGLCTFFFSLGACRT